MTQSDVLNLLLVSGGRISKTFKFGKIAYQSKRKANLVDVTINLYLREGNKIEFTASGRIWNHIHSDIYCGGQCLDEIAQYVCTPEFKAIYTLWKKYHLNSMHAGTEEQEEFLDEYFKAEHIRYDYSEAKKILEENNLLTVKLADGTDYTYGTGWLYRAIPEEALNTIVNLITGDKLC